MIHNKLYTIVKGENDPEGQMIRVRPTKYLKGLEPREAITELQAHVESLAEKLEGCSKEDLEVPENIQNVLDLMFEVEIAQGYLAQVFKAWQATQQGYVRDPGQ